MKTVLRRAGVLEMIRHIAPQGRVEILLYHGFTEGSQRDPRFPGLMPTGTFEEHIRVLSRYGRPLALEELAEGDAHGTALTFDDGYRNNYRLAFPVLEKYHFPATVFVTTGFVDRTVPLWGDWLEFLITRAPRSNTVFEWRKTPIPLERAAPGQAARLVTELKRRLHGAALDDIHAFLRDLETHLGVHYSWDAIPEPLRPLSWEEIRTMRASGLITFGSHTVSHPVLSRCELDVQRAELLNSKRRLEEELGAPCTIFAYPYGKRGDYTNATKQMVREAGYTLAVTVESGSNRPSSWDRLELKRWGADISASELAYLVSGAPAVTECVRQQIHRSRCVGKPGVAQCER